MELSAASTNGTAILYRENFWTGKKALIINGTPATKIGKKQFSFTAADGKATFYTVQGSFISGVKVEISDPKETVVLAQNMWYDWVILVLSLIGILPGVIFCGAVGGFFSALCCFLAAVFNMTIARSKMNVFNMTIARSKMNFALRLLLQIVIIALANAVWVGLWFVIVVLLLNATQGAAAAAIAAVL